MTVVDITDICRWKGVNITNITDISRIAAVDIFPLGSINVLLTRTDEDIDNILI